MKKLKAKQLRKKKPTPEEIKKIKRNPIFLVLDDIIDTYNVGSLFRLADAIAARKIYLCGETEYPPSSRIHKAAVGTENWVPWEKVSDTYKLIQRLKSQGVSIIVVEQSKKSIDYRQLERKNVKFPCAIVVGNETEGVARKIIDLADIVVELPMYGINKSFNVWGSAAIIAYKVLEFI